MGSCGHRVSAAEFLRAHPPDRYLQTLHDELNLAELARLDEKFGPTVSGVPVPDATQRTGLVAGPNC